MLAILLAVLVLSVSCAKVENADDLDCRPGSLDSFSLPILLLTASNSPICMSEARRAFSRTYKRANFYIEPFTGGFYEYKKQTVRIKNFNTTRDILQTFGDFIRFIDISFDGNETDTQIVKLIDDKCTASLFQLHLKNCYGSLLEGFKRAYSKVTKVTFSTISSPELNVTASTLKLDELFPHVKNLNVEISNVNDWILIGNNYSKLRTIRIAFPKLNDTNQPEVESLFHNCPNLTSLVINNSTLRILKAASERLPNLKSLQIFAISDGKLDGDKIQFKNVSRLYMSLLQKIPPKLAFNRVKFMELDLNFDLTDEWTQFFQSPNKTVEYFYFKVDSITNEQLTAIAESQPNITLANISTLKKIPPEAIVDFMGKSSKLYSLGLNILNDSYDIAERAVFEESLRDDWSINADTTDFIRLKNNGT